MPHGVKVNRGGTRAYISCMHSDELVEVDVATLTISRRARTGQGHAVVASGPHSPAHGPAAPASHANGSECSPTYVSISPDGQRLYVACNASNSLQVWDAGKLERIRDIPVGKGAYNVEPSSDGKIVVVTNKKDQSISLIDASKLVEIARIPTSKKVVHGVAYSPDSKLAYVSCESIGADSGSVDVIDLGARKRIASIPIAGQPTGITLLSSRSNNQRP
jgi:YVTN family beta-propeller protein